EALASQEEQLKDMEKAPEIAKIPVQNEHKVLQYQVDHDVNPYEENNWTFMNSQASNIFIVFALLFVIIISSDNVSGEFSRGTIKMLMVRPHSRWKILLSKYVAVLLFSLFMLLLLFVLSWLM